MPVLLCGPPCRSAGSIGAFAATNAGQTEQRSALTIVNAASKLITGELVRKYTEHLVQRYGKEQVGTWYFEVWNEPDIAYWHGTSEEYNKLYDYAVAGVRAALPNAIVGGPASTGPSSEKASLFLDNFLKHCLNDKSAATGKPIPLDFISFHPKGRPTVVEGHVRMGLANELKAAGEGFRIVAKYPKYIHLPIILSEADSEGCAACSIKVNPSNAYRNGPLYPVYTAAAIKSLFALQDRYKVNLLSMLSCSFEFEDKGFFEGFRTLATNGVDKPVINVFRMAGLMSGQRVSTSSTGQVPLDDILNIGVRQAPDVGLGTMGSGMAVNLLKAGFSLAVYNRTAATAERLTGIGARFASTPAEAGKDASVIISMLADDQAAREVWLGKNGAPAATRKGAILIESSTVSPEWVAELAQLAEQHGSELLDAPVTGSRTQAEAGQLSFLVGGKETMLAAATPALKAMSKEIAHLGPVGSGAKMKLINKILCGLRVASLAEGLAWTELSGLDRDKALSILKAGAPGQPASRRDFGAHDQLNLHRKLSAQADDKGPALRAEGSFAMQRRSEDG